ncbi:MAG TPA: DUF4389 domain-containing protein [Nocardioidaceae bacterium]|nr:DUF4389 domain-containing protein [Nocardioidaceae bacterium]
MSSPVYPVHVNATLDTSHLSRWLWLVKWLLAIPHYVVLAFLWLAFFVLSVGAFFAILFTGRYPRAIFDFNVGVLRWSWRVAYYTYGALATDRYPPFTLAETPDYPAHLTVDYPEHLSRGLVLVKWWLLAIPHYLVVGFLAGSGVYVAWDTTQGDGAQWTWGSGLIGLLVFFAAVILLFTGRYPQQMYDLVLGLNRWVIRVAAYAGLMTDEYPPFRLDMGGADPVAARVAVPAAGPAPAPPAAGSTAPTETRGAAPTETGPQAPGGGGLRWGPGRVLSVVLASLLFLVGGALMAGGATLGVAGATLRNDAGFLMSPTETVSSAGYAIASQPLTIDAGASADWVPQQLLGDVTVEATGAGGGEIFVGVARSVDAAAYLAGVEHTTLLNFEGTPGEATPEYRQNEGGAPEVPPGDAGIADIWVATASGTGEQTLTWAPAEGDWTVVLMNADASSNVAADVSVGAEVPVLWGVVVGLLVVGGILVVAAIVLLIIALTVGRRTSTEDTAQTEGATTGAGPTPGAGESQERQEP